MSSGSERVEREGDNRARGTESDNGERVRTTARGGTGASWKGRGWKTAKICITIADRNNYARNARERGGGIRARMQMRTVESDAGGDGAMRWGR